MHTHTHLGYGIIMVSSSVLSQQCKTTPVFDAERSLQRGSKGFLCVNTEVRVCLLRVRARCQSVFIVRVFRVILADSLTRIILPL